MPLPDTRDMEKVRTAFSIAFWQSLLDSLKSTNDEQDESVCESIRGHITELESRL